MFKINEVIHVFKTLTPITSACLNSATKHYQRQRQSQRQECTSSASIRTNFWACCCPWILMCTSCTLLCACLSFGWPANIFTIPHCDCNESQGVGTSRLSSKKHFQICGFWRVARNYTFGFEALLKSRLCYWLSIDLLCRSPPGDQVGNLFSI